MVERGNWGGGEEIMSSAVLRHLLATTSHFAMTSFALLTPQHSVFHSYMPHTLCLATTSAVVALTIFLIVRYLAHAEEWHSMVEYLIHTVCWINVCICTESQKNRHIKHSVNPV